VGVGMGFVMIPLNRIRVVLLLRNESTHRVISMGISSGPGALFGVSFSIARLTCVIVTSRFVDTGSWIICIWNVVKLFC
jgi:hypothetical protein